MTAGPRSERTFRPPEEAYNARVTAVGAVRHEVDLARVTVVATGELDLVSVDDLEVVMRKAVDGGCRHLVLDLRDLSFIDSQGLHLMMRWNRLAERYGIAFTIIKGGPAIQRVVESVGLGDQLCFVDAIEDADPALQPSERVDNLEPRPTVRLWTASGHEASPQPHDPGVRLVTEAPFDEQRR